jgi:mRNA-degrading endonuclease RelE of RelBE toxin-antitoxin system
MVQNRYLSYLLHDRQPHHSRLEQSTYLPRTRDILQKLHDSVRNVLERSQVYTLVIPELPIRHVSVILDDLSNVLRGKILPYQLLIRKQIIAI